MSNRVIPAWVSEAYENCVSKMRKVMAVERDFIPYTTGADGRYCPGWWDTGWWTNGFWGGIGWQLYHGTGEEVFRKEAIRTEEKMDAAFLNSGSMDHDSGFRWLPISRARYQTEQNPQSRNRLILAADNLCGRFNPVGKFIRAWNDLPGESRAGIVIIDCMMNLPLLYWAYEETGDHRYLHIAKAHAETAMKYFIREDGSSCHIISMDPEFGGFIDSIGGQGYGHGSSWTRGQTWALYGFALSYQHTGDVRFLETSRKVADYFISCIPDSGLIPVDFRQPAEPAWEDSSAAAIAACGFLQLARLLEDKDAEGAGQYYDTALFLLKTLTEKRCDFTDATENIVQKCTAAYHDREHEFALVYADYYYIEALAKLLDKELFIW